MKMKIREDGREQNNPWIWFGVVCAILAMMDDKGVVAARSKQNGDSRRSQANFAGFQRESRGHAVLVHIDPLDFRVFGDSDGQVNPGRRHVVVIADKDDAIASKSTKRQEHMSCRKRRKARSIRANTRF